jgi:hypothetical protein
MSDLSTSEPNTDDERPAFLGRIRPVAKMAFALFILWVVAGFAQALWEVVTDVSGRLSGR